ncbi:ParA family protein [Pectinatus haikarae]|uniref:Chromosome partitioning protein n=1 Tax=Pectinatus haikarae TaxID=349096 RepID=A0ABT9Y4H5_9FIRM|nr:ParA family protein [Pectinatus haikarae]MDQ0202456.1 chromosome partitioning protein [Pectinatus haikarae]
MIRNVISFLNMKGGVGKTTLCKELAVYFSEVENKEVLVIDIDPQSNCTQSLFERFNILDIDKTTGEPKLIDCKISKELPSIDKLFLKGKHHLTSTSIDNVIKKLSNTLSIIPGDLDTVFMERETGTGASEQRLFNFIDKNNLKDEYDYIFIDCPPTYSFYTVAAVLASDFYFVPLKPDAYSLLGLDLLERVINDMQETYSANFQVKKLENLGVIFTMVHSESKTYYTNMSGIKSVFSNLYFFDSLFFDYPKMAITKLSKFIIDRQDKNLINELSAIGKEFIERMKKLNGE